MAHGIQQGWVDASHPPLFAANGDAYFLLLPVEDGERGAFKQVVMVNASVSATPRPLGIFMTVRQDSLLGPHKNMEHRLM